MRKCALKNHGAQRKDNTGDTATLVTAKEISMDAVEAAVLSELDVIFTLKE